jgi:hypothetical protein
MNTNEKKNSKYLKNNSNTETYYGSVIGMAEKRVHNPQTGSSYKIREKTTKKGKKGQIMGRWSARTAQ